jgi:hypothetical protein
MDNQLINKKGQKARIISGEKLEGLLLSGRPKMDHGPSIQKWI